jgi:hypothetical protein
LKAATLQIGDDRGKRVGCASFPYVHQNNGAIELLIASRSDAVSEKFGALRRLDGIETVERPVNGAIAKRVRQAPDARIARPEGSAQKRARILSAKVSEKNFRAQDFIAHDGVRLPGEIDVVPGVIADLVPLPGDFPRALRIFVSPFSGDEKGAGDAGVSERFDQVVETIRFASRIESERNSGMTTRSARDLQWFVRRGAGRRAAVEAKEKNGERQRDAKRLHIFAPRRVGTTSTGRWAERTVCSATLPISAWLRPVRP